MNIIRYPAQPNVITARMSRPIRMLLWHGTGGVKAGDLWTLTGRDRRQQVSAHYYITKQGEVYQLVRDQDIAWHAGVAAWQGETDINAISIGVELENLNTGRDPYPEAQLQAAIELGRAKISEYDISPDWNARHSDVAPRRKKDPVNFPWLWFCEKLYAPPDHTLTAPNLYRVLYRSELRTAPRRETGNIVGYVRAGEIVPAWPVEGQAINGNAQWLHRVDQVGFVWSGATEPVSVERP